LNKARIIIGLVVTVISFTYLGFYAIPHLFEAQEVQRQAQTEYDQAMLEQEQAMDELNVSIDDILNEESIN
jgi:hypothetical protein